MDFNGEIVYSGDQTFKGSITIMGTLTLQGTLYLSDGTISAPSLAFTSDKKLGLYKSGSGEISFVTQGAKTASINSSSVTFPTQMLISPGNPFSSRLTSGLTPTGPVNWQPSGWNLDMPTSDKDLNGGIPWVAGTTNGYTASSSGSYIINAAIQMTIPSSFVARDVLIISIFLNGSMIIQDGRNIFGNTIIRPQVSVTYPLAVNDVVTFRIALGSGNYISATAYTGQSMIMRVY